MPPLNNVAGIKVAPAQSSPPNSVISRACFVAAAADEQDGCAAATTAMCATNVYRFFHDFICMTCSHHPATMFGKHWWSQEFQICSKNVLFLSCLLCCSIGSSSSKRVTRSLLIGLVLFGKPFFSSGDGVCPDIFVDRRNKQLKIQIFNHFFYSFLAYRN